MKSSLTYDMHNYAAVSSLHMPDEQSLKDSSHNGLDSNPMEKYSLRQRQKRKYAKLDKTQKDSYPSKKHVPEALLCSPLETPPKGSRQDALKSNAVKSQSNSSKAKSKPAPLSKYRRKTANARERTRMREINTAFETLRHCVPHAISGDDSGSSNEKLTKITTLRLAMKYISVLTQALADPSYEADFLLECKRDGDHRFTTSQAEIDELNQMSQNYHDVYEEEMLCDTLTKNKTSKMTASGGADGTQKSNSTSTATTRKPPQKRQSKKQKMQQNISPYSTSTLSSTASKESVLSSTSSNSACASFGLASPISSTISNSSYLLDSSLNSSYISNINHSMSDLSSMLLDSDGESLHLSEHCLSPLQGGGTYLLGSTEVTASRTTAANSLHLATASFENPLELSLHLLESSNDSLSFSIDHQPSACLSPLVTLDTFNPFGDLLQSDLPEHTLDMFLT